jgi:hypothetical protein
MITCIGQCNKKLPIKAFREYKDRHGTLRLMKECKQCQKAKTLAYYRTIDGLISGIYTNQKGNSEQRGSFGPSYSLEDLSEWIKSQKYFINLYNDWVNSNYDRWLVPSVDRLEVTKSYSLDNIELVTWKENSNRENLRIKNGDNPNITKKVNKLSNNGTHLCTYVSVHDAARQNNLQATNIVKVCKKKRQTTGGYKWEYAN